MIGISLIGGAAVSWVAVVGIFLNCPAGEEHGAGVVRAAPDLEERLPTRASPGRGAWPNQCDSSVLIEVLAPGEVTFQEGSPEYR